MIEIILTIILVVVCVFIFLFIFWRELKEDYIPSQIFTTSGIIILFALASFLFTNYYFREYRFWFIVLTLFIGYIYGSKKSGLKFYEGLDSFIIALLFALTLSAFVLYSNWTLKWILFYLSIVLSVVVYLLTKKAYKTFIWYKSGKRGFPGLFTIGLFFLIRSTISLVKPDFSLMLTEYDIFFSGLLSFISFLNIFVLANK
jgi:hypothetical protein